VVDGVFQEFAELAAPGIIFHPASGIDSETVAQVEATRRRRILRGFVGRGLLESFEAKEMLGYAHSGFSVDAGVCITLSAISVNLCQNCISENNVCYGARNSHKSNSALSR
jgi:hypothetical protein